MQITQIGEKKKLDNVFQLNCSSHAYTVTSDKSEKNRKTA